MKKVFKIFNFQFSILNSQGTGFTLVEIAIVLVIIGLLVAIGAGMMGPLTKRAKYNETREAVKAAREAVIGYVVKNGFLPADLETAGARNLDASGNQMVFYRAVEFDASGEDACGITSTTLGGQPFDIRECTNDDCSTYLTKSNMGFIVFSKGTDANEAGTDPNKDGVPPFYVRIQDSAYTDGATTYNYDDIVQYSSLDEIRSLRGCIFKITNQTLIDTKTGAAYSLTLSGTGGQTPYTSWTTGQAQGACAAGSVRLVASDIGLCLNTTSGLISGTPTTAGAYNFTVTLTDANGITTSTAFTLNVIDSCLMTGIYNYNATGANREYKILALGAVCTTAATCNRWDSGETITIQTNQTYCFYTTTGAPCSNDCTGTASITYTAAQTADANENCLIQFTSGASTCISGDK